LFFIFLPLLHSIFLCFWHFSLHGFDDSKRTVTKGACLWGQTPNQH
jgi:hypothetical protein